MVFEETGPASSHYLRPRSRKRCQTIRLLSSCNNLSTAQGHLHPQHRLPLREPTRHQRHTEYGNTQYYKRRLLQHITPIQEAMHHLTAVVYLMMTPHPQWLLLVCTKHTHLREVAADILGELYHCLSISRSLSLSSSC